MKTRSRYLSSVILGGVACFALCLNPVFAYVIDSSADMPNKQDFMVGPGRHEILLSPGESAMRTFSVTNRYNVEKKFQLVISDFTGSKRMEEGITLLGEEEIGPYSLKDFLHPEVMTFTLQHGDRITIPVKINIPVDAQPGGLYGAILVKEVPLTRDGESQEPEKVEGGLTVEARIATLFFVRIRGEADENGSIKEFSSGKKIYGQPPIDFKIIYQNQGNVYLSPFGQLTVNNLMGTKVGEAAIDPFYVMPDSLRLKTLGLDRGFMFGRYTATLTMHRGYLEKDITDTATIVFWVLPWKIVAAIVLIIFIIILIISGTARWFNKNFERKPKNANKAVNK